MPDWAVPAGNVVVTVGAIAAGFVVPVYPAVFEAIFYVTGRFTIRSFNVVPRLFAAGSHSRPAREVPSLWGQGRSAAQSQFEFEPSPSETSVVAHFC